MPPKTDWPAAAAEGAVVLIAFGFAVVGGVVGWVLGHSTNHAHPTHSGLTSAWHIAVGYSVSLLLGTLVIWLVIKSLQESPASGARDRQMAAMVGVIERVLYTGSWQAGKTTFIGVWLALKTVQRIQPMWRRDTAWLDDFNVYLIGNAFSVGFGVLGGLTIAWLEKGHDVRVLAVTLTAMLGSATYIICARACARKPEEFGIAAIVADLVAWLRTGKRKDLAAAEGKFEKFLKQ